ncbi:MAG: tetratricopeptide repeat protein [Kiritimatiellia bacterium]
MSIFHTHVLSSFAVLAACSLVPVVAVRAADDAAAQPAAEDPAAKVELEYIGALVDANMPDFAEPVIAAAKKKWPQLGPRLKVLELQGALRLGKFDDVQKVVNAMKEKNGEYWALRLSMADAYYARSMMPECRKIYEEFFKTVQKPGADLLDFYVESGFKWAHICVNERNFDEALKMYTGLRSKLSETGATEKRWCTVAMAEASLLIRLAADIELPADPKKAKPLVDKRNGYLAQASKLVDKLLWKNELIIVFGKAIAMKAHIAMLRGDMEKAQDLVNDYMPQLAKIHESLVEQDPDGREGYVRMSPMPECRYLLAKLLWETAKTEAKAAKPDDAKITALLLGAKVGGKRNGLGAFNHAVNVYVKYPESSIAGDAGQIYEEIAAFVLERYKKDLKKAVKISPEHMKKVIRIQFENAFATYRSGNIAEAIKTYSDLVARYPDAEEVPGAIAVLADCYLSQWQDEKNAEKKKALRADADAKEDDLAARFAGKGDARERAAGDELLRLAAKERELGQLARSQQVYDLYFKKFPNHYNASQRAWSLAGQAYVAEDWEAAAHYYELVATAYTNSPHVASALQFRAQCAAKTGDVDGQMTWLRRFSEATKKVSERTATQIQLAQMQRKIGFADFAAAAETNDVAAAEALRKGAYRAVADAIKEYRTAAAAITKELESNKGLSKEDRERFLLHREQAMFLEGDCWQRLTWPEDKISVFRAQAVKAYERYLEAYPKGTWGPAALVKIGTIYTAEKNMEESQKAFARLQSDFPESDEAKNSVPRLAKTLIEMGLRQEGVAEYKQMLETTGGKYSAGQFLAAGDALLEAKGWDVAAEAYTKAIDLSKAVTNAAARTAIIARSTLGQAKAAVGQQLYAEAHQKLDQFVEKYAKSQLVVEAYEMIVEVASEEGRREKDDELRRQYFNAAVRAIKKLRGYQKTQAEIDLLDLRSGEVLVRKMEAEEAMNLKEKALETCGLAANAFQTFLMSHEPTPEHPAKDMTPAQLANLERCYSSALPLMAKLGKEQADMILKYGAAYLELFPDGKHKTAVQNAVNQAQADK